MKKLPAIFSVSVLALAALASCSSPASSESIFWRDFWGGGGVSRETIDADSIGPFDFRNQLYPTRFHVNHSGDLYFVPERVRSESGSKQFDEGNIVYKVFDDIMKFDADLSQIPDGSTLKCNSNTLLVYEDNNHGYFGFDLKNGVVDRLPDNFLSYFNGSPNVYYGTCQPFNIEKSYICGDSEKIGILPLLPKHGVLVLCEGGGKLQIVQSRDGDFNQLSVPKGGVDFPQGSHLSLKVSYNPRSDNYLLYHPGRSDSKAYWMDVDNDIFEDAEIPNSSRYAPDLYSDSGRNYFSIHFGPVYDLIWSRGSVDIYKANKLIDTLRNVPSWREMYSTKESTIIRTTPEHLKYNILKLR